MSFLLCIGFFMLLIWIINIQSDINSIKNKIFQMQKMNFQNRVIPKKEVASCIEEKRSVENVEIVQNNEQVVEENQNIETNVVQENQTVVEINENVVLNSEKVVKSSSFEEKFFGNVFNKIGALAILIALCILIKIISPFIIFTNGMKITLGFILGLGMIFGAFKIRNDEKMKKFAEVLLGTGFGSLFITIYCAAGFMNVFSAPVAAVLALLILIAIYYIADKQKTTSTLVIGLIGGYLSPFLISNDISIEFLFIYLLFLNILSLVFVYRNQQKNVINTVNLCLTSFILFCYSITGTISLYQIISLWAIYVIFDILCILKNGKVLNEVLKYVNFGILLLLGSCINDISDYGVFVGIVALIYCGFGFWYLFKTQEKENGYFRSFIIATFISIFCLTYKESLYTLSLWALEALIIGFVSLKYGLKKFFNQAVVIFSIMVCSLFFIFEVYKMNYENLIFNSRILYFLPPVISAFLFTGLTKKYQENTKSDVFKFLGISLVYIYLIFEINSIFTNITYNSEIKRFIFPILFFIYSLNFNLLLKNIQTKTLYYVAKNIILWLGVIWLIFGELFANNYQGILPITNLRLVAYGMLVANILYELKSKNVEWKKYFAIVLGFLYIHFESVNIANYVNNIDWIITIMWILYSGIISLIGIFKNIKSLKIAGIWLSILTVCRLFIYDLSNLNMLYKLVVFITLGVVLLVISYLYNKRK